MMPFLGKWILLRVMNLSLLVCDKDEAFFESHAAVQPNRGKPVSWEPLPDAVSLPEEPTHAAQEEPIVDSCSSFKYLYPKKEISTLFRFTYSSPDKSLGSHSRLPFGEGTGEGVWHQATKEAPIRRRWAASFYSLGNHLRTGTGATHSPSHSKPSYIFRLDPFRFLSSYLSEQRERETWGPALLRPRNAMSLVWAPDGFERQQFPCYWL